MLAREDVKWLLGFVVFGWGVFLVVAMGLGNTGVNPRKVALFPASLNFMLAIALGTDGLLWIYIRLLGVKRGNRVIVWSHIWVGAVGLLYIPVIGFEKWLTQGGLSPVLLVGAILSCWVIGFQVLKGER